MSSQEIWKETLESLRSVLILPAYEMFLKRMEAVSHDENSFRLRVQGPFAGEYFREYQGIIEETIEKIVNRPLSVVVDYIDSIPDEAPAGPVETAEEDAQPAEVALYPDRPPSVPVSKTKSTLNDMYTFSTFVVGEGNQFCYNTSRAVAEKPGAIANPLFIYGDVGLGKTHLLHAIGNYVIAARPDLRVVHRHAAAFVNEMMNYIRDGRLVDFRNHYLHADLFLIDDIHNLKGREGTQNEFFQIFNAFYENKKQIVVTCDRPPKELKELEERVVSRLGWGVIADIQAPNFETRLAILKRKLSTDGMAVDEDFPEDVLEFIASKISTNIRDLEGALMSITARAKYNNQKVTIELAEAIISNIAPVRNPREITPLSIIREVCTHFNVHESDVLGKRRKKEFVLPRMIAMYLIRNIINIPLVSIGEVFNKDHTSVLYSCEKVEKEMRKDPWIKKAVVSLKDKIIS